MRLFLDTNIFLDATLPGRAQQQDARLLLNAIALGKVIAYAASFSIATVTYFLQKAFKEDTSGIIVQLLTHVEVVDLLREDFIAALALGFSDLEDAYQYIAAAKARQIDYLVTQNVKDFKQSTIEVIKPDALLKLL
jgi:predicted nucleic acid-binding protein